VGQERWLAMLGATYVSPMREQAGSGEAPPGLLTDEQLVFDGSASYRIFSRLKLYLNARNLLDRRSIVSRRPFGARPNEPRSVQVGVKVEL
jgi:Fe(3+) dicitrate transport protein